MLPVDLDDAAQVAHVLAAADETTGSGQRMHAVERERAWLVGDREVGGDADPHLPVLGESPTPVEPAQPLVHLAPHHHAGRLKALADGDPLEPARDDPGLVLLKSRDAGPVARLVHRDVAAECGARLELGLEQPRHRVVEPVTHAVVAVQ